jgi:hypothetical protein
MRVSLPHQFPIALSHRREYVSGGGSLAMSAGPQMRIIVIEFNRWHMERFVAECNINRFEQLLCEATDPVEQRLLEELLAAERLKLSHVAVPGIAAAAAAY